MFKNWVWLWVRLIAKLVVLVLCLLSLIGRSGQAWAQATPGQPIAVLTIVLRDSIGNPLEGVTCEILSYDWGLQMGQAYAVIARGETDKNGVVAFDESHWPFSGYRLKFTPTGHTKPANTYFLPDSENQYRGYPGISTGGLSETQKFVLSGSDGLFYNDLSKDGQLPIYQRDPVGGMEKPRVSVMPGKDFVATALAATTTAEARGEPTPTFPPPPPASPRPGEIQPALTVTPGAAITDIPTKIAPTPAINPTGTGTVSRTTEAMAAVVTSMPTSTSGSQIVGAEAESIDSAQQTASTESKSSNLFVSILLAGLGLTCLFLFWNFRHRIYPLLGIETTRPGRKSSSRLTIKNIKPQSSQIKTNPTAKTDSSNEDSY